MSWKVDYLLENLDIDALLSVTVRVFKKLSTVYPIEYCRKSLKVNKTVIGALKDALSLTRCLVTHDTDFINLEKRFNEFSKVLDRLEKDARAFRDSISGREQ